MNSLTDGFRALVLGSSGAIGSALVRALQADPRCAQVHSLHRGSTPALELGDEAGIAAAAAHVARGGPLHLVLCATGALHVDGRAPE